MIRVFVILAVLLLAPPAWAQPARFMPDAPDTLVRQLLQLARDNLHRARDQDGNPLPGGPAPSLSLGEARAVIDVGMANGAARWCGLDWMRSQQRLIAEQRARRRWSEREIAFIAVLHDVTLVSLYNEMRERPCPEAERTRVSQYLARRWGS